MLSLGAFAQQPPDLELIEDEIKNPSSQYFYPNLMGRYRAGDSTLTASEYRHLYYGYVFQDSYKPLLKTNYSDSLEMFAASGANDLARVERFCKAVLSVEPFNMRDINVLAYAYHLSGQGEKAAALMKRVKMIEETITSTGSGLYDTSPWWIIYPEHAEDILNLLNLDPMRRVLINNAVEFWGVRNPSDKSVKGYYFNYSTIYRRSDYLEGVEQPKRKLQIN